MHCVRVASDERPESVMELKVLSTWRERLKGLLGTTRQAPPVLLAHCASIHTHGMTYDLDVAFVGVGGKVLRVCRGLVPGCVESCWAARCVIERPARPGPWIERGDRLWVASVSVDGIG